MSRQAFNERVDQAVAKLRAAGLNIPPTDETARPARTIALPTDARGAVMVDDGRRFQPAGRGCRGIAG